MHSAGVNSCDDQVGKQWVWDRRGTGPGVSCVKRKTIEAESHGDCLKVCRKVESGCDLNFRKVILGGVEGD